MPDAATMAVQYPVARHMIDQYGDGVIAGLKVVAADYFARLGEVVGDIESRVVEEPTVNGHRLFGTDDQGNELPPATLVQFKAQVITRSAA
ncbi:hypothetical protein PBI_HILLTOPFARM_129 [Mycobacterium phage Hilltopfarm]|nr:hypothetical protein PBI_HILLTOPFARM_129 [Mycobacterium phage Hilltopfarm]